MYPIELFLQLGHLTISSLLQLGHSKVTDPLVPINLDLQDVQTKSFLTILILEK
tara:strand:- start:4767 stop:4928 length:162 start_codon:yes stop_codon:yes gene_type:complete